LREAVDAAAVAPGWIRGLVARRLAEFLDAQGRRDDAALLTGVD
jgi:hypothetical protein